MSGFRGTSYYFLRTIYIFQHCLALLSIAPHCSTFSFNLAFYNFQDEDVDIEEEVDLYDPVTAGNNELSGNNLLSTYYLINDEQHRERGTYLISVTLDIFKWGM